MKDDAANPENGTGGLLPALLNLERLDQYSGGNAGLMVRMREAFLEDMDQRMALVWENLDAGRLREAGEAAHYMASGAIVLGLDRLREAFLDVERHVRAGDRPEAADAARNMEDICRESLRRLDAHIEHLGGE